MEHLFHAFAIDKEDQAYDVEGKYNYLNALEKYKTQTNPKTGNIAHEVNIEYFDSIQEFNSKFNLVETNESFIIKAVKKISANPLNYFNTKRIKSGLELDPLLVNKNFMPGGDNYYNMKNKYRIFQKMSILLKKRSFDLDIWKINGVHSSFSGFILELGLGSFDFDMISIEYKINCKETDISDEESKNNIIEYFNNFNYTILFEDLQKSL